MAEAGSPQLSHQAVVRFYHHSQMHPPLASAPVSQGGVKERRAINTLFTTEVVIPMLHLGPLNALVTSIKDSGMDPPRSSDLCPYALSCMSSGELTPFSSEAVVCLNGLTHPIGVVLVP